MSFDTVGSWAERLRRFLDAWYGTVARYAGLVVIVYAMFVDKLKNPALITLATGLVLLKTVVGGKDE